MIRWWKYLPRRWKWWFRGAFVLILLQVHSFIVGLDVWVVALESLDAIALLFALGWILGKDQR